MVESNIEKYLGITDLNETDFTKEDMLEIIDLYLKQKPYLEGTIDEDVVIFKSSSEEDITEFDNPFEPCFFNEIHDSHYVHNLGKIRNKYGKNPLKIYPKRNLILKK